MRDRTKNYILSTAIFSMAGIMILLQLFPTNIGSIEPSSSIIGLATQIIDLPESAQRTILVDLAEGTLVNAHVDTGKIVADSSNAYWISNTIDTRPNVATGYSFWESIEFVGTNPSTTFQTRTSSNGVSFSTWTDPKNISGLKTITSPQDQHLEIKINLLNAGDELSAITAVYSPAFEYNLNIFYDGPTEVNFSFPAADRRVVAQGDTLYFVNPDNSLEEARFYGIQMYSFSMFPTQAQADSMCVNLRNRGYNLIKTQISSNGWNSGRTIVAKYQDGSRVHSGSALVFNTTQWDKMDYFISRCKQEGIYVHFRLGAPAPHENDVFNEFNIRPTTLYSERFDQTHSDFHEAYYTKLLNHTNPYTGIKYADDPAIALLELGNEDSLFRAWHKSSGDQPILGEGFFPTVPGQYAPNLAITPTQNQTLNQMYNDWLVNKYSSRAALLAVWGDETQEGLRPDEDPTLGTVRRIDWRYPGGRSEWRGLAYTRVNDDSLFYQELESNFYAYHKNVIKNVIGAKGLFIPTNTVRQYYDLEAQNSSAEVLDQHSYFQGQGVPDTSQILSTMEVNSSMIFTNAIMNVKDKPLSVSEYNDYGFNIFGGETIPFFATYSAFQGVDSAVLFDYTEVELIPQNYFTYGHSRAWDPVSFVQTPLASKAFREWITPANTQIEMFFTDQEDATNIVNGKASIEMSGNWFTLGANEGGWKRTRYIKNNYLFRYGYVINNFHSPIDVNFDDFISNYGIEVNPPNQITSDTGELYIDGDLGIFKVLHPKYQGVAGLIAGQTHILPDAVIDVKQNIKDAGTVMIGSLDNQDITISNKLLVSVGGRSENYGLLWEEDHSEPQYNYSLQYSSRYGSPPVLATIPKADIQVNTFLSEVTVYSLDVNGNKKAVIPSTLNLGIISFSVGPADETLWYLIEAGGASGIPTVPQIVPEPQEIILGTSFLEIDNTWTIMKGNNDDFNAEYIRQTILNKTNNAIDLPIIPLGGSTVKKIIVANPADDLVLISLAAQEGINPLFDITEGYGQGYILKVTDEKVIIFSNTSAGRFYGGVTLDWLTNYSTGRLLVPQLRINDWPDLEIRGITTGTLNFGTEEEQIDYLTKLKYNLWIEKPVKSLRQGYSQASIDRAIFLENYLNERQFYSSLKSEPSTADKNYREGHYAEKINFEFDSNNIAQGNDLGFRMLNNGFEKDIDGNGIADGWSVNERHVSSFWEQDCTVSLTGSCSMKHFVTAPLFSTEGDFLTTGVMPVKGGNVYAVKYFARSDGQPATVQIVVRFIRPENVNPGAKYITISNLQTTWTEYTSRFWVPDNTYEMELYFRPYGQTSGNVYVDNVELVDLTEKLYNVIETPATQLLITSLDELTTYVKDTDYTVTETGFFNSRIPFNGKNTTVTRIPTGNIPAQSEVLVSYDYLVDTQVSYIHYMSDGTTTFEERADRTSYNDPGALSMWEQEFVNITYENLNPEIHMFWLDEIRGFNRDSRRNGRENYEVLADWINDAYDIVQTYSPDTRVLMWHDIISPFHNGQDETHQVRYNGYVGATRYASQLINKNVVPIIWWYSMDDKYRAMTQAGPYYKALGLDFMVSGWDNEDNTKWLSYICKVDGCLGYITTDWQATGDGIVMGANYSWNSYEPDLSTCNINHMEVCDGLDNDCDADYYEEVYDNYFNRTVPVLTTGTEFVDEEFNLSSDEFNCGVCGNICNYAQAKGSCNVGICQFDECLNDYHNLNGDVNDGCEYFCELSNGAVEILDGLDNDCNGLIDDGVGGGTAADIDNDGDVDVDDLIIAMNTFGLSFGQLGYDSRAELTGDNKVNILDMVVIAKQFT